MGEIVIKKKNTTIDLFNYKPFRSVTKAELSRTLMSDDYVDISVECANTLDLNIGDRVTVEGRTYFLNMLPPAKKIAEDQFTYELRFEGPAFLLRKLKVFNLDSQGNKTTNEFPLTGEINEFLYLLINNANKKDNQWILGSFPSNTETKTLTFNNENCLAVLQRICQEFNVEFEVEETGGKFVLHIREKIGKLLPFTVEYGMGNGLYDLSRARANDSEVVTVLYAYGSSQNIPVDYRGYSPRLRMPVAVGDYISNQAAIDLFGYVEDVFTPDIKPTFKGKVSGIGSLANGVQEISVSNMDFDLKEKKADGSTKYLIAGTPAKISVTKGDLAGYDFEVLDYIHATKTFKIKQFADDRGQKFPDNTTVFKFSIGDEFTLIDIMMPEQYIINAEQKLYDETVKEYQKASQNNVKYTLNVDPLFLQDKGEIGIGDLLPIKDADFGIDKASRIISLKKDLLTDTYTSFDVADSYEISLVKEIVNNIKDLQKEIASQKVINRQSYLDGYRRVEDRFSMYFDADGKMDGSHIKADTIDVGMLSSGSKSRWFQLEEVVFTPNLGSDPNSFRATAGRLVHFGIKTSSGTERVWNLSALTVNNLLNQGYYVYAKCDINGDYGTFIITPDKIVFDSQPNYYHFLIGNLYTSTSGGRAFDANYGVSQMNGRMIFAGVISDIQGRPMIDLDKREIIGKVTFTNDSPALGQVQEKIDAVQVGTRNLLLKSKQRMPYAWGAGSVIKTSDGINFQNCTTWVAYGTIASESLQVSEEYTISIKYRSENTPATNFAWYINDANDYISFNTPDTVGKWGIISNTRRINNNGNVNLHLFVPNGTVTIDWIVITKGNKGVTDWTPAPEDLNEEITVAKQNAANAQNTANTAVQNAIDANKKLSDIANDNIVTPQEKPDTLKEWKQIEAERPKLVAQAGTYNINTDNYNNYYVALANYLTNSGVFLDMNVSTNVDGREFKNNFQNYYDVRQDLLKAISDAAKTYANGLVDNLQIGGRNLLQKSANIVMSGNDYQNSDNSVPGELTVLRLGKWNCYSWLTLPTGYDKVGKQLTMSLELYVDRQINFGVGVHFAYEQNLIRKDVSYITPGKWTKVFITYDKITGTNVSLIGLDGIDAPVGTKIKYRNFKLEEGNKATDWTPAPEDVQEQLANAQNSANTANQKLADIANDNILTTSEKPDVVKEWQEIDTEYPKLILQSNSYNVDNSIYRTFYSALSAYLLAIQYDNFTIDTPINGQEFRQKFREYYDGRADLLSRITTATKNYTNQAAGEIRNEARLKLLASQYTNGNCLYRDVDFRTGLNGLNIYNNLGNGTVEVFNWAASSVNAPTKSPNIVICRYNGGGASPHLGGFYFGAPTRANAVFVVRLIMRLDIGYQITFHSNATGDGSTFDWATPVDGTGKWEEYIGVLRCGATGTFSSSMFFAIAGANKVIETYIAYASVFDVTDVDKYLEDRIKQNEQQTAIAKAQADNALATSNITSQKVSFLSTTINNNVVSTGTLEVGDVVGANAGITGVTDRGRQSVRMYAGAPYANKNTAPFTLQDDGLIKMHHPNGNKGFELGIVDGKLVFNVYDDIGNKIMEMGSQGIVFSNYIPDSWTNLKIAKFDSANYNPYDATSATQFANSNTRQVRVDNSGNIEDPQHWNVFVPKTEASHINYSTYSAGRSYDSNTYVIYEGIYFEGTLQKPQKPNNSTPKLADGWYYNIVFLSVWKQWDNPNMTGQYSYPFQLYRLSAGKVVETKEYVISGQV
ncbi:TPA: hypothetical protein NEG48_001488 [Elizabethkingia anophelis]|nr:hypothetical protein [Elizabethkingia anophelis]